MFTEKYLFKLIVPLVIEQLFAVTVGMADTFMIAKRGEESVAGISAVDNICVLLIGLFSALATGGAVVVAQFLGQKNTVKAKVAANQLVLSVLVLSVTFMTISLIGNETILHLIYSELSSQTTRNAKIYYYIIAVSFPFLAIYNVGAALFRTIGNSKISMKISFWMNIINIFGNAILIFGFDMGVAGAGVSTLLSRMIAAIIIMLRLSNQENTICIDYNFRLGYQPKMIRRILKIGIPNGLENSIFQFGKLLVGGLIASYGEVGMTANAIGNSITSLPCIPGKAIGLAMISVVGQCVGAGKLDEAKRYTWKLLKYASISTLVLNVIVSLCVSPIVNLFEAQAATKELAIKFVIYDSICCSIFWPSAFTLPNALRAANDVKYTMLTSIVSMWIFRVGFSFVLAQYFGLGVFGVWVAMSIDWCFRAILFIGRMASGGWKKYAYIGSVVTK